MAPSLSFVKLDSYNAIPIRIHINRKKLLSSSLFDSTINGNNSKAIVSLRKINTIRLSNKDINSLTESIERDVIKILIETPLQNLKKNCVEKAVPNLPSTSLCLDITTPLWKCHLVVSIKLILYVRIRLGVPLNTEEQLMLEKLPKTKSITEKNLLIRKLCEEPTKILIEDEEDSMTLRGTNDDDDDTKKTQITYKFSNMNLINDVGSMDIYIYERLFKNK